MKRRDFIKAACCSILAGQVLPFRAMADVIRLSPMRISSSGENVKDYLYKMRNFNSQSIKDILLPKESHLLLHSTVKRLSAIQKTVGFGNFKLLDFDGALKVAKSYPSVGVFSKKELNFLEMIFFRNAIEYGFADKKPLESLTARIDKSKTVKIPGSGNYLFAGLPFETYQKVKKDIGSKVVLTSGIRGIPKQFLLFLNKADCNKGNLSLASRSLAPPGYSYHSVGDFDVGQKGFGRENFTDRFTTTDVYQELSDLGYINLRYTKDNLHGVRFEPWHIKLV